MLAANYGFGVDSYLLVLRAAVVSARIRIPAIERWTLTDWRTRRGA